MNANGITSTKLIRDEFTVNGNAPGVQEFKSLTKQDQIELASAIARNRGLDMQELAFEAVAY